MEFKIRLLKKWWNKYQKIQAKLINLMFKTGEYPSNL